LPQLHFTYPLIQTLPLCSTLRPLRFLALQKEKMATGDRRYIGLVTLPQVRRQDVELFAVFGDGAAGDFDALFGEGLHQGFVGERLGRVFRGNELLDGFAHAGVRDAVAAFGLIAGGKERAHFHQAVGREDVLARDGT